MNAGEVNMMERISMTRQEFYVFKENMEENECG
jgi:hypothetical protein